MIADCETRKEEKMLNRLPSQFSFADSRRRRQKWYCKKRIKRTRKTIADITGIQIEGALTKNSAMAFFAASR